MVDYSGLSVAILYPLSLLADGCVLIAVALAASLGGRPWVWGAAFASCHLLYAVVGMLALSELGAYSDIFGDLIVFAATIMLLHHFLRHRSHIERAHTHGEACHCAPAQHTTSPFSIWITAGGLSLHALAAGAVIRGMSPDVSRTTVLATLGASSVFLGILIGTAVYLGRRESNAVLPWLDRTPGVVTLLLTIVCGFAAEHAVSHMIELSSGARYGLFAATLTIGSLLGLRAHESRNSEPKGVIQIASRKV